MSKKVEKACELRDIALQILQREERWTVVQPDIRLMEAAVGSFKILHRTPFSKLPGSNVKSSDVLDVSDAGQNLSYGVDIWKDGKKVMNVEWDERQTQVVSLRSGDWQAEFKTSLL